MSTPHVMKTEAHADFGLATEEYESIVASAAAANSSADIPNRHIAHAAILTKYIIRHSEQDIKIVTGSLPELFFNRIKSELEAALKRGVSAQIIFINKANVCQELNNLLGKYRQLQALEIPERFKNNVKRHVAHFCVSDKKRFRLEEIHEDKDFSKDPSIRATANFNHPQIARELHTLFESLSSLSQSVEHRQAAKS